MMRLLLLVSLLGALVASACAQYYGTSSDDMPELGTRRVPASARAGIRIEQKLSAIIPPDIEFVNEKGTKVTTGDVFSERPTLLLMVFYNCTGVCSVELNSLVNTVDGIKPDVGDAFNVVVVSIDYDEGPELAAGKKETYTDIYNRSHTDDGWHFLTGTEANIKRLADAVGFHFYRDPRNGEITHPAGLMVVSPHRRLTRYFVQDKYDARPLLTAIEDSAADKVGLRDDSPFFLNCVNIDPLTGYRTVNVMNTLKTLSVVTVLVLAVSIIKMSLKK